MSDDATPLYEGLDPSWNDVVSAFPEDKRNDYAGFIKNQLDSYAPLKQYEDLHKSGITADQASQALNVYSVIENNPRQVYDLLSKHLNITPQQAQQVAEEAVDELEDEGIDPRIQTMQQQIDRMAQILLNNHEQETRSRLESQAEAQIDQELSALQKKYGENNVDTDQVILYMLNSNMSAEDAYKAYTERDARIRATRPSPMLMGGGGQVPPRAIDPTKLDSTQTKNLVAQMLQHANEQASQ